MRLNSLRVEKKSCYLFSLCILLFLSSCDPGLKEKASVVHSMKDLGITSNLLFPTMTPDRIILNLTNDPIHSVAVNWRTDTTVIASLVQIAPATSGPEFITQTRTIEGKYESLTYQPENDPEVSANYHSAIINGLNPGEKFVYRVGSEEAWSEWFQIEIPEPKKKLSFVYFGDAQNNVKSMWSRVIRQAYGTLPEVDFMLHAGDLINRWDRDQEWGEWFYAGSFIHAMVPSVMTPGNHEYKNVVLSPQWKKQFNLPANGPKGLEETCYQVNYPNLKIISLDGEQIDESESFREAQRLWVDSILTHDPKQWTAITFHYPMFSTKPNRDNVVLREQFKPIFDKHKVDIVLQGHDHAYGRGMVNNIPEGSKVKEPVYGTVYVVSVSGPKMYEISDDPWMTRRAANTQLFQIITIEGNTLSYGAYTANGELYDAFDLVKNKNAPNKIINMIPDVPERLELEK
jgi:acid phosphatase type 7